MARLESASMDCTLKTGKHLRAESSSSSLECRSECPTADSPTTASGGANNSSNASAAGGAGFLDSLPYGGAKGGRNSCAESNSACLSPTSGLDELINGAETGLNRLMGGEAFPRREGGTAPQGGKAFGSEAGQPTFRNRRTPTSDRFEAKDRSLEWSEAPLRNCHRLSRPHAASEPRPNGGHLSGGHLSGGLPTQTPGSLSAQENASQLGGAPPRGSDAPSDRLSPPLSRSNVPPHGEAETPAGTAPGGAVTLEEVCEALSCAYLTALVSVSGSFPVAAETAAPLTSLGVRIAGLLQTPGTPQNNGSTLTVLPPPPSSLAASSLAAASSLGAPSRGAPSLTASSLGAAQKLTDLSQQAKTPDFRSFFHGAELPTNTPKEAQGVGPLGGASPAEDGGSRHGDAQRPDTPPDLKNTQQQEIDLLSFATTQQQHLTLPLQSKRHFVRTPQPVASPQTWQSTPPTAPSPVSFQKLQCFKTKQCRFWLDGRCTRGTECTFAHSDDELRDKPDLTKTKICAEWRQGSCHKAAKSCTYAHGNEDLRQVAPPPTQVLGGAMRKTGRGDPSSFTATITTSGGPNAASSVCFAP